MSKMFRHLRESPATPEAQRQLIAGYAVGLLGPAVAAMAAVGLSSLLNDATLPTDTKVRAAYGLWSMVGVAAAMLIPMPVFAKALIIAASILIPGALWVRLVVWMRSMVLAAFFGGMVTAVNATLFAMIMETPLAEWTVLAAGAVGAVLGVLAVMLAKRSDPPRKGLAYGV
ncbi:MAG: hypothetical protein Q8L23_01315 [Caulobacter sp.]|nr:hypothetical protein [Caulobacter sp.]